MSSSNVKQVIVIRKDLKMRRGKEIAQGAHASMGWLIARMKRANHDATCPECEHPATSRLDDNGCEQCECRVTVHDNDQFSERVVKLSRAERQWVCGRFTKICLQVESESELMAIHDTAVEAGLTTNLIIDAGLTEFDGVLTRTCLAIGPNESELIDKVTAGLKLY